MAFNIAYKFQVLDGFSAKIKKFQIGLKRIAPIMKRVAQKTSADFRKIGGSMDKTRDKMKLLAVGITGFGFVAGRSILKFEQGMNLLQASSNVSDGNMAKLRETARDLGRVTEFSAGQSAFAMAELGKAGLSTQEIIEAIPVALRLASAGSIEIGEAAGIMASSLRGFGIETKEAARVADVLSLAASSAKTTVPEMGHALSKVGPIARSLGVDFETAAAVLATFQDQGIDSSIAGTGLKGILAKLSKPTKEAITALKKRDVSIKEVEKFMKKGDIVGLFKRLEEQGIDAKMASAIFGLETLSTALSLAGSNKEVAEFVEKLKKAEGTAKRMADTNMKGLPGAIKKAQSAFESLQQSIGEAGLTKRLIQLSEGIIAISSSLEAVSPGTKRLVVDFGLLFVAITALMTPIVSFFSSLAVGAVAVKLLLTGTAGLAKGMTIALGPIGLVIAAITALVAGVGRLIFKFSDLKKTLAERGFLPALAEFFGGDTQAEHDEKVSVAKALRESGAKLNYEQQRILGGGPKLGYGVMATSFGGLKIGDTQAKDGEKVSVAKALRESREKLNYEQPRIFESGEKLNYGLLASSFRDLKIGDTQAKDGEKVSVAKALRESREKLNYEQPRIFESGEKLNYGLLASSFRDLKIGDTQAKDGEKVSVAKALRESREKLNYEQPRIFESGEKLNYGLLASSFRDLKIGDTQAKDGEKVSVAKALRESREKLNYEQPRIFESGEKLNYGLLASSFRDLKIGDTQAKDGEKVSVAKALRESREKLNYEQPRIFESGEKLNYGLLASSFRDLKIGDTQAKDGEKVSVAKALRESREKLNYEQPRIFESGEKLNYGLLASSFRDLKIGDTQAKDGEKVSVAKALRESREKLNYGLLAASFRDLKIGDTQAKDGEKVSVAKSLRESGAKLNYEQLASSFSGLKIGDTQAKDGEKVSVAKALREIGAKLNYEQPQIFESGEKLNYGLLASSFRDLKIGDTSKKTNAGFFGDTEAMNRLNQVNNKLTVAEHPNLVDSHRTETYSLKSPAVEVALTLNGEVNLNKQGDAESAEFAVVHEGSTLRAGNVGANIGGTQ